MDVSWSTAEGNVVQMNVALHQHVKVTLNLDNIVKFLMSLLLDTVQITRQQKKNVSTHFFTL